MSPDEVPDGLVEKAKRALIDAAIAEAPHLPVEAIAKAGAENLDRTIRIILAAVLPEIQRRAQQALIADLLDRDLWSVRYTENGYPIQAVPQSALLERRNRIGRLATTTGESSDV